MLAKTDKRVVAAADIEETKAVIALAISTTTDDSLNEILGKIQNQLFALVAKEKGAVCDRRNSSDTWQ